MHTRMGVGEETSSVNVIRTPSAETKHKHEMRGGGPKQEIPTSLPTTTPLAFLMALAELEPACDDRTEAALILTYQNIEKLHFTSASDRVNEPPHDCQTVDSRLCSVAPRRRARGCPTTSPPVTGMGHRNCMMMLITRHSSYRNLEINVRRSGNGAVDTRANEVGARARGRHVRGLRRAARARAVE